MIDKIIKLTSIILITITIIVALILFIKNYKKITSFKFKDFQVDFTDFNQMKSIGEGDKVEKFRMLLLRQLLFTQEFVNRFQPLLAAFVHVSKKWDENAELNESEIKYPSLKYSGDSLNRFRDLLRNTKFNYVINWDCPIYDKVNSGYRESFISSIGHLNNEFESISGKKLYIPNLIEDCSIKNPTIDIKEKNILTNYSKTKLLLDNYIKEAESIIYCNNKKIETLEEIKDVEDLEISSVSIDSSVIKQSKHTFEKLKECIAELESYIGEQSDREEIMTNRYNYAMDVGNTMYESLLYWNEKSPRILQSETSSLLYIIYQNLSLWLIRNDLPLSQVKLDQYLDAHSENLVARLNEEIIKQMPRFHRKMWEQALQDIKVSDSDINKYFRNNLKDWIIGIQQVRFGINIFIGSDDYQQ